MSSRPSRPIAIALFLILFFAAGCKEVPPTIVGVGSADIVPERLREPENPPQPEPELAVVPAMNWRPGPAANLDALGGGDCLWRRGEELIPLPLLDIDVELRVAGPVLTGTLKQSFLNASDQVIEAIYAFPLPENAAVHAMELRVGERRIVAVIKEKAEARRRYEAARAEGRRTALVEQERPNLFTTSVASIPPGEKVAVELVYVQELEFADGRFGLHFPLTITPRYLPAGMRPTILPAAAGPEAAAIENIVDGARVTPPFRSHGDPDSPRARIRVSLAAGLPLDSLDSTSHAVEAVETEPGRWRVRTREAEVLADRDFRLEWRPAAGAEAVTTLFLEEGESGDAHALLMVLPPSADAIPRRPTDTLFVVDVSGSMDGPSIQAVRVALLAALEGMGPEDRFAFLLFNHEQRLYAESFLEASRENLGRARRWVERLSADGGTEIHAALVRALLFSSEATRAESPDSGRLRRMVFLTDGAVGNEAEVLGTVAASLGDTRIHALGIGPAPNRYLLRRLALLGRGSAAFLDEGPETAARMREFLARFERPLFTDLWLGWEGLEVEEVYPARLPDLHAGEALFVSARLAPGGSAGAGAAVVQGSLGAAPVSETLTLAAATSLPAGAGLSLRWARAKVGSLMDGLHHGAEPARVREQVLALALEHRLVTRYTSLVAEEQRPVVSGPGRSARVPGALPEGSTLMNRGRLPRGGTGAPLRRLLGAAFVVLAIGLAPALRRRS